MRGTAIPVPGDGKQQLAVRYLAAVNLYDSAHSRLDDGKETVMIDFRRRRVRTGSELRNGSALSFRLPAVSEAAIVGVLDGRHDVAGSLEGRHPAAIEESRVPAHRIGMQMLEKHVVDVFRLH